jgi:hypothetical protein
MRKVTYIDVGNMSSKEAEKTVRELSGGKKENKFLEFFQWFFAYFN